MIACFLVFSLVKPYSATHTMEILSSCFRPNTRTFCWTHFTFFPGAGKRHRRFSRVIIMFVKFFWRSCHSSCFYHIGYLSSLSFSYKKFNFTQQSSVQSIRHPQRLKLPAGLHSVNCTGRTFPRRMVLFDERCYH